MHKTLKLILAGLSVFFFVLNFIHYNIVEDKDVQPLHEKFDPSLARLNSLAKLEEYVDSLADAKNISDTLDYAIMAKDVVSQRFYHKYASQDLDENWIASFAQKLTGLSLSSKITADDILTRQYGYCGQQNSVLMELLQKKQLQCRALYFPHHFVIQAKIRGLWHYFDPDKEPNILPQQRSSEKWLFNRDSLAIAYHSSYEVVRETFGDPIQINFGKVDEVQGPNAQIFQSITRYLSKTAFLIPLLCLVYLDRTERRTTLN